MPGESTPPQPEQQRPAQPARETGQESTPKWFQEIKHRGDSVKGKLEERFGTQLSRRELLTLGAVKALEVASYLSAVRLGLLSKERLIDPVMSQLDTYDEAKRLAESGNEDAFLEAKKEEVKNTKAPTSFRPQAYKFHLNDVYELQRLQSMDSRTPQQEQTLQEIAHKKTSMEESFKIMVEKFGIKDVRLGIEWADAIDGNGNIDLRYYQPILDYSLANNVRLTMNVGIKTFGYPEVKIPTSVLGSVGNPKDGTQIVVGSGLGAKALAFTDGVAEKLQPYASIIDTVQADNEWGNKFGPHQWDITPAYEAEAIKRLSVKFSKSTVLVSFPGTPTNVWKFWESGGKHAADLRDMLDIPRLQDRVVAGDNYYHIVAGYPTLPVGGSLEREMVDSDTIRQALSGARTDAFFDSNHREISEAQLQRWDNNKLTAPGSSLQECLFMLSRCFQILDAKTPREDGGKYGIRIWGIEDFLQNYLNDALTSQQKTMVRIIARMNGKTKEELQQDTRIAA